MGLVTSVCRFSWVAWMCVAPYAAGMPGVVVCVPWEAACPPNNGCVYDAIEILQLSCEAF